MLEAESNERTGKRLNVDEIEYLRELVNAGYTDSQIADAICSRFGREDLDRTTIYRNKKKLGPPKPEDRPWHWEEMNDYGLPWEASRVLMDCWTRVQEEGDIKQYPRPFTVRLAKWCYRVDCACPGLRPYDLLRFARDFSHAEMAKETLKEEVDTSALTAYISINPDESDRRAMTYHRLADSGVIKALTFGRDSRAELELEARLYPDDPSVKEAIEQLDAFEASKSNSEQDRKARRTNFQRRQAIIRKDWEDLGSPQVMRSSEFSELLPGELPSLSGLFTAPRQHIHIDLGFLKDWNKEETELC